MLYTKSYASVNIHRLGLEDLEVEVRNSYNNEVLATGASLAEILTNPECLIQEEGPDSFSLWFEGRMVCCLNQRSYGQFTMRIEPFVEFEVALRWYILQLTKGVISESFDLNERTAFLLSVARFGGTDKLAYDLWFSALRHVMEVSGVFFVSLLPAAGCLWVCAHRTVSKKNVPKPLGYLPNIGRTVIVVAFVRMIFKYFVARYVKREKVLSPQSFRLAAETLQTW
ncbi:hypothetical protein IT413_02690 [Candidatus Peregrinibacteria bacterium]|nr:hypothetical protein [Candidatus Peregrinibacteria bacterium]